MSDTPAAPTTEAGRRLVEALKQPDFYGWPSDEQLDDAILAIEAEARAAARKEVLDEVRASVYAAMKDMGFESGKVVALFDHDFDAILDSLSTDTREEPE